MSNIIFSPSGKDPFNNVLIVNPTEVKKEYIRETRGYVLQVSSNNSIGSSSIKIPKNNEDSLNITSPLLFLQLKLLPPFNFSFEIELYIIKNENLSKRRFEFSSSLKTPSKQPLNMRLPFNFEKLISLQNEKSINPNSLFKDWFTLAIDLTELTKLIDPSECFAYLHSISFKPSFYLRFIYSLTNTDIEENNGRGQWDFPLDLPNFTYKYDTSIQMNQDINKPSIKKTVVNSKSSIPIRKKINPVISIQEGTQVHSEEKINNNNDNTDSLPSTSTKPKLTSKSKKISLENLKEKINEVALKESKLEIQTEVNQINSLNLSSKSPKLYPTISKSQVEPFYQLSPTQNKVSSRPLSARLSKYWGDENKHDDENPFHKNSIDNLLKHSHLDEDPGSPVSLTQAREAIKLRESLRTINQNDKVEINNPTVDQKNPWSDHYIPISKPSLNKLNNIPAKGRLGIEVSEDDSEDSFINNENNEINANNSIDQKESFNNREMFEKSHMQSPSELYDNIHSITSPSLNQYLTKNQDFFSENQYNELELKKWRDESFIENKRREENLNSSSINFEDKVNTFFEQDEIKNGQWMNITSMDEENLLSIYKIEKNNENDFQSEPIDEELYSKNSYIEDNNLNYSNNINSIKNILDKELKEYNIFDANNEVILENYKDFIQNNKYYNPFNISKKILNNEYPEQIPSLLYESAKLTWDENYDNIVEVLEQEIKKNHKVISPFLREAQDIEKSHFELNQLEDEFIKKYGLEKFYDMIGLYQ